MCNEVTPGAYREKVVTARQSGTTGAGSQTVGALVTKIGGKGLIEFDEIHCYLAITQSAAGGGSVDVRLQRAIRPNPAIATDADWEDYAAFPRFTGGGGFIVQLPHRHTGDADPDVSNVAYSRTVDALGTDADGGARVGHWGDQFRVRETITGTVSTPAIYDLYMTGIVKPK